LKLIALIERPTRGQLIVNGQNVAGISRRKIPAYRRKVGMVFQDHKLLHDRTIFDNVALPLIIAGVGTKEIGKRVRAALDQVGLLGREQSVPLELSTGEQQRVGIARAVVSKPPILIADEPTGNFAEVGVTVLVASHDVYLLEHFRARRVRLEAGRIVESTSEAALLDPAALLDNEEPVR
jgi:cell division transport system ATP-binding protein